MNMKRENIIKSLGSVFRTYLFILESYVEVVEQLHHSIDVNEIKSYQGIILRRIANSMDTLDKVLVICKDPISAYSLLRTLADSICAYCFIYENDDNDEVEFRHFLYLLDGCSQFINAFPPALNNREVLEKGEDKEINNELNQEKMDLDNFQKNLLDYLYNTNIARISKDKVTNIIKKCDWKYKTILHYSKNKSYNWKDIYEKAGCDSFMMNFFSTLLSQYVHGLFLSNTKNPDSYAHYSLVYDIAISLEKRIIWAIHNCFKEDDINMRVFGHIDFKKLHEKDIDRSCVISYFGGIK